MMWWRRKPPKPQRRVLRARLQRFVPRGSLRPALLWGGGALLAGTLAWGSLKLWREGPPSLIGNAASGIGQLALAGTSNLGFAVGEVLVEGRTETRVDELMSALGVRRGEPILAFNPAAARAALLRLPWIRSATVERRMPETIFVRIEEREPLALWQHAGRMVVIDRSGAVIEGADPGRWPALKIVVGEGAPRHTADLLTILASEPALAQKITHAVRVGSRRWNLRLEPQPGAAVEVQLPEENPAAAWLRLADAERAGGLFQRNVQTIDMRLPDRMILRVVRDAPPAPTPAGPARPVRPATANRQT
ncbi:MAG: FtsQ-type POTRA domain-containing protein [Alphaproteobacteria bacterium]|nr:FtsQ-type POTRA domain-containing protein [Alphaproteobacteria bacterium]